MIGPGPVHGAGVRVLITVPGMELAGGVANYYRTLRRHLDADKVYFEIGRRGDDNGIGATIGRLIADSWRFHRMLSRERWNLVHVNPSLLSRALVRDGILLLIARAHRQPVLVFFRGWDQSFADRVRTRHRRLFRAVYGRASAFIVLAEEFRRALIAMDIDRPIFGATTVVDDSFIEQERIWREQPDGSCHVLYLSRLERGKGLIEAIEAFALVRVRAPRVSLTIAGEGPERARAEVLVRERGIEGVTFVGHADGAAKLALLRRSHIYFFPTAYGEGMPNAVLEAMACGLAIVTRRVGGLNDFFEDGRMGFITSSREPSELAALVSRLVDDSGLRESMGRYNREYARSHFTASVVSTQLLGIYAQVAGPTAAR